MDGISLVQARIADIEQRFTPADSTSRSSVATGAGATQDFGAVLEALVASTTPTPVVSTQRSATASPDLAGYANGKIPEAALTEIGIGNHRLSSAAATAFTAMRADAATSGVEIGVTDSYRTLGQQVDVARRKGLYSQGGLAAQPGTSNHGWGLSVDVDVDSRGQEWLRANGARYGFVEDVAREPWHWTYRPDQSAGKAS